MAKRVSSATDPSAPADSDRPAAGSHAEAGRLRPLTEHLLAGLPGPRAAWVAAWALVPWANAGANLLFDEARTSAVWEQSEALVIVNYAALSLGVAVALWGAMRIADRLEALPATTRALIPGDLRARFQELNSRVGPVATSLATAFAFGGSAFAREGWGPALLRGGTWFVIGIALWTFVWAYRSLQFGLNRLGRATLLVGGGPEGGAR